MLGALSAVWTCDCGCSAQGVLLRQPANLPSVPPLSSTHTAGASLGLFANTGTRTLACLMAPPGDWSFPPVFARSPRNQPFNGLATSSLSQNLSSS